MLLGRLLGWVSLGLMLLALGGDALRFLESGDLHFATLADFWRLLDPESLPRLESNIRTYLWPPLWESGLAPLLALPAVAVLGGLGVILLLLFRKRPARRRTGFS